MNRSPELNLELVTNSEEETVAAGRVLGNRLKGGEVITLSGPLGAGKTSFVKGVGKSLNIPSEMICSPTFILRAEHGEGRLPLAHVDLYRLGSPEEAQRLGLFEQEEPLTVLLIEWPERAKISLPPERVEIEFQPEGETKRRLCMTGIGYSYSYLLDEFK